METGSRVAYADDVTMRGEILDVVVYESYSYRVRWEDGTEDWHEGEQIVIDDQEVVDPLATVTAGLGRDSFASSNTPLAPRRATEDGLPRLREPDEKLIAPLGGVLDGLNDAGHGSFDQVEPDECRLEARE